MKNVTARSDGRCPWCGDAPDYIDYHDQVWGRPVTDRNDLFEKLCLDGQQAGLSWLTILRKQSGYRQRFEAFQPERLAAWGEAEIQAALAAPGDKAGWYCPRRSYYFDRFMGHCGWYPDYLLRVFRLEQMQLKIALPHYSFHPVGPTGTLAGDIVHYPYSGLSEHVAKINAYTQSAAEDKYARGERAGLAKALGHALARFVKIYLLKRGFLDGRAGLVLALNSFFYVFHKYIRMAELEAIAKQSHGAGGPASPAPDIEGS